jgi:hypothetical protein
MQMNIKDPKKAVESLIGQAILGFEINEDDTVTISLSKGYLLVDFDMGEIYVEVKASND